MFALIKIVQELRSNCSARHPKNCKFLIQTDTSLIMLLTERPVSLKQLKEIESLMTQVNDIKNENLQLRKENEDKAKELEAKALNQNFVEEIEDLLLLTRILWKILKSEMKI